MYFAKKQNKLQTLNIWPMIFIKINQQDIYDHVRQSTHLSETIFADSTPKRLQKIFPGYLLFIGKKLVPLPTQTERDVAQPG